MARFYVRSRAEQCDCEQCGFPLDIGDSGYETGRFAHVYCSLACAQVAATNELAYLRGTAFVPFGK